MGEARDSLNSTLEKLSTNSLDGVNLKSKTIDTQKLLKGLKYSDVSTVDVCGQKHTYVSLDSIIGAIENSQIDGGL